MPAKKKGPAETSQEEVRSAAAQSPSIGQRAECWPQQLGRNQNVKFDCPSSDWQEKNFRKGRRVTSFWVSFSSKIAQQLPEA